MPRATAQCSPPSPPPWPAFQGTRPARPTSRPPVRPKTPMPEHGSARLVAVPPRPCRRRRIGIL
eukprot:1426556-Alexandrium_andersonii.AAC.1